MEPNSYFQKIFTFYYDLEKYPSLLRQYWGLNPGSPELFLFRDIVSLSCLNWPQTWNLPASASCVTGTTDVHHHVYNTEHEQCTNIIQGVSSNKPNTPKLETTQKPWYQLALLVFWNTHFCQQTCMLSRLYEPSVTIYLYVSFLSLYNKSIREELKLLKCWWTSSKGRNVKEFIMLLNIKVNGNEKTVISVWLLSRCRLL